VIYFGLECCGKWLGSRLYAAQNFGLLAVCAVAFMIRMDYNFRLNATTKTLEVVEAGMKAIVPVIAKPTTFVLFGGDTGISPWIPDIFVKTLYRSNNVNLRILLPGPPITDWKQSTDVVIGPDEKGIYAENTLGNPRWITRSPPSWIPYSNVVFIRWDGAKLTQIDRKALRPETLSGYSVAFGRKPPLGVLGSLEGWIGFGTYRQADGSILLQEATPAAPVLMERPLQLHKNTRYEISLRARTPDANAFLLLDLYNGASYDFAEQDAAIQGLTGENGEYHVSIPAGPAPPPTAFLRIYSTSSSPIWIWDVKVRER